MQETQKTKGLLNRIRGLTVMVLNIKDDNKQYFLVFYLFPQHGVHIG